MVLVWRIMDDSPNFSPPNIPVYLTYKLTLHTSLTVSTYFSPLVYSLNDWQKFLVTSLFIPTKLLFSIPTQVTKAYNNTISGR